MKKIFLAVITIALMSVSMNLSAKPNFDDDDLVIKYTPQQYDSLINKFYETNIMGSYENFVREFIDIEDEELIYDNIPDSVYEQRLRMIASSIQLPYNSIIKKYIQLYTKTKREQMGVMLGRAQYYFPMIEEQLYMSGLPVELKILPIIESALYTKAISRVGAAGLWQFMFKTGRQYGLEINSFVDERFDVEQATKAACKFLGDLYKIYGDWTLAIAAYNCGPGNVNKALKRAPNAKTYWDIYEYLPKETRGYIPSFIAATYAYTFHKAHNIELKSLNIPLATDTIQIKKMTHFEQISSTLDIPIETLRALNPQYKKDIIPVTEKHYALTIPTCELTAFIEKEAEIYAKDSMYLKEYLDPDNFKKALSTSTLTASNSSKKTHKVKTGDTLGRIADKYNTTVKAIMKANNIKSANKLSIGKKLYIP